MFPKTFRALSVVVRARRKMVQTIDSTQIGPDTSERETLDLKEV